MTSSCLNVNNLITNIVSHVLTNEMFGAIFPTKENLLDRWPKFNFDVVFLHTFWSPSVSWRDVDNMIYTSSINFYYNSPRVSGTDLVKKGDTYHAIVRWSSTKPLEWAKKLLFFSSKIPFNAKVLDMSFPSFFCTFLSYVYMSHVWQKGKKWASYEATFQAEKSRR